MKKTKLMVGIALFLIGLCMITIGIDMILFK